MSRAARAPLRVLDLSKSGDSSGDEDTLERLVGILAIMTPDGIGANLRTLQMWTEFDGFSVTPPALSAAQAQRILAACPRLDSSSRLAFNSANPAEALELLEAAPGRHLLNLHLIGADLGGFAEDAAGAYSRPQNEAALRPLLSHPRLACLDLYLPPNSNAAHTALFDLAVDELIAVLDAAGTYSIEELGVYKAGYADADDPPAFRDAAAVADAAAAAASRRACGERARRRAAAASGCGMCILALGGTFCAQPSGPRRAPSAPCPSATRSPSPLDRIPLFSRRFCGTLWRARGWSCSISGSGEGSCRRPSTRWRRCWSRRGRPEDGCGCGCPALAPQDHARLASA